MKLSPDKTILLNFDDYDVDDKGYLKIPDSVVKIGKSATFNSIRNKLKIIDISNVEEIGENAFKLCSELETVIGTPKSIDETAFFRCKKLKSIDLSQVVHMGSRAFASCYYLETVNIKSLENIPHGAFTNCYKLSEIYGAPKTVGDRAFQFCEKLTNFDFSKILSLDEYAFAHCGLLEADISRLVSIPEGAFSDCDSLEQIAGAPSSIGRAAFWGCSKLRMFDFSNLKEIGHKAFFCSALADNISEKEYLVHIECDGFSADYAKVSEMSVGEKVGSVIDESRSAYCDENGNPFIINGNYRKVFLQTEKELFMQIWNAS